jgi:hypothetical protein
MDVTRLGCGFLLAAAVSAALVPAAAGQGEPLSASPFGVVCPWPGIREAGIKWCRVGAGATAFVNWPEIEKSPGTWDWTAADNELRQSADPLGLSLLPIFGYTPRWASRAPGDPEFQFHPPKDVAKFARFVRRCVARYKHRVKVWEVWNEPNIDFFRGSAAEYAEMVMAAAVAARQEDPDCRIAMGCAGVDLDFLERLYEFGCGPYFDVMSVHPYQWGRQLNDAWMIDKLQGCRQLMDRRGDGHKEIWITEIGWSVGEGVTPPEQANLLAQAIVTALSVRQRLKVEKVFWFCVKDWGGPGHGLFDVAGQPKPALAAYQAVVAALGQARYHGPWKAPEGVRGHLFERNGKPVLVLWTPSPDGKVRVELKTSAPKLSLRTLAKGVIEIRSTNGRAEIEATHAPVFLTGLPTSDLETGSVPSPKASPLIPRTKTLGDVWFSVLPPATTARPYLLLDGQNRLALQVHNAGRATAGGELQIELAAERGVLASGQIAFAVAPGTSQTVVWRTALPARHGLVAQIAQLHVKGRANGNSLAPIDLPVRLVRSRGIEFAANSWIERQYLHKAEKSGCADSVRFGSQFGYRFELPNTRSAQLRINVGANGAGPWELSASKDDKHYVLERSGRSWPSWQTVSLDRYLAGPREASPAVYVKIHGTDCQVREVVLETEAEGGLQPAIDARRGSRP